MPVRYKQLKEFFQSLSLKSPKPYSRGCSQTAPFKVYCLSLSRKKHYAMVREIMQYFGGLECTNEEKCLLSTIMCSDKWYLFGTYLNSNGTFYLAIVAYYPHLLSRLTKLAEWIAYHDVLPAQSANAEVVTLGQVSA